MVVGAVTVIVVVNFVELVDGVLLVIGTVTVTFVIDSVLLVVEPILLKNKEENVEKAVNKYRVLRSCDGDHLYQSDPVSTNRTEGMARVSGINQKEPQKLMFQVS